MVPDTAGTPTAMKGRGAAIAKALGGAPMGETAFGLSAAKKDLATAVQFGTSIHAELPVTVSALACYEEAEAAGLGDADATAVSTPWTPPKSKSESPLHPTPPPPRNQRTPQPSAPILSVAKI